MFYLTSTKSLAFNANAHILQDFFDFHLDNNVNCFDCLDP